MPCPRRAFTLIELLIVVVVIGIMAAIALPKITEVRRRAQVTAAKAELRTGLSRAEAYFADNGTYAGLSLDAQSPGVILSVTEASETGYRLVSWSVTDATVQCTIAGGTLGDGGGGGGPSGTGPVGGGGKKSIVTVTAALEGGGFFGPNCR